MENRAHALMAGLFTLILLLGIAFSAWWLSGHREATQPILLVAKGRVDGLNTQSQVRFRGLRVGKVTSISIEPSAPHRILVTAQIAKSVPLSTTTSAQLNMMGVTGLAYIQLDEQMVEGQPLVLAEGQVPRLMLAPSNFDALSHAATDITSELRDLVHRANHLLSADNTAHFSRTLAHLETGSASLAQSLDQLPKLLTALRTVLDADNLAHLKATLAHLEQAGAETGPLLQDARRAVARLDAVGQRLDHLGGEIGGELSADTLPRLAQLMSDLSGASRDLSRTLESLRETPQSLIYGRPPGMPGPGEPAFRP